MSSHQRIPEGPEPTKIAYVNGEPKTLHLRKTHLVINPGVEEAREYTFDQDVISIGTLVDSDILLDDDTVSREHCRVVQDGQHTMIIDRGSTNGTYVSMQGSPVVVLKREELPLFGEGVISLGEAVRDDDEHLIRFAFD
jgi:pSer/pThr/pTyr-binding forkhead associated (FHA) protein